MKPTIGRIVHVGTNQEYGSALPAIITKVHSDTDITVTRFNIDGTTESVRCGTYKQGALEYHVDWQWPPIVVPKK